MNDKKIDTDIVWAPWMRIMLHGADCLVTPSEPVEGLAAPQVGHNVRLIAVDCSPDQDDIQYLVNPEIVSYDGYTNGDEGCLSFPGLSLTVRRYKNIEVKAQNLKGEEIRISAGGLLSICIQHEIDHLDGITFIQRVSRQVRRANMRKWEPMKILEVQNGDY